MDALYTVPDVARRWGVCAQAVYKLLRTGQLRGFKAGKEWRVTEEALREYELPPLPPETKRSKAKAPLKIH